MSLQPGAERDALVINIFEKVSNTTLLSITDILIKSSR